jgi:hypothetical protein
MSAKLQIVRRELVGPVDFDRLLRMRPDELHRLYRAMFGRDVQSGNSEQARRRIAWRVQSEREGGLPDSARRHALAMARESAVRIRVGVERTGRSDSPRHATVTGLVSDHDPRVPMPGSVIVKEYRGRRILVRVLDAGFEWDGRHFLSLSAVARDITGTKWNGLAFFGLAKTRASGR